MKILRPAFLTLLLAFSAALNPVGAQTANILSSYSAGDWEGYIGGGRVYSQLAGDPNFYSIFHLDLTNIPAGDTITAAELSLGSGVVETGDPGAFSLVSAVNYVPIPNPDGSQDIESEPSGTAFGSSTGYTIEGNSDFLNFLNANIGNTVSIYGFTANYSGTLSAGSPVTLDVTLVAAPEPAPAPLILCGLALLLATARRLATCAPQATAN